MGKEFFCRTHGELTSRQTRWKVSKPWGKNTKEKNEKVCKRCGEKVWRIGHEPVGRVNHRIEAEGTDS